MEDTALALDRLGEDGVDGLVQSGASITTEFLPQTRQIKKTSQNVVRQVTIKLSIILTSWRECYHIFPLMLRRYCQSHSNLRKLSDSITALLNDKKFSFFVLLVNYQL